MRFGNRRVSNFLSSLFFGCILFLTSVASPPALHAQGLSEPTVRLSGHVLEILPTATKQPRPPLAAYQPLTWTVMLNWTDPASFDAYVESFEDPTSPDYRHTMSPTDVAARFGPSQQAYDTVLARLQQNGFTLVEGSDNRLTLTVRGTRAQAEHAFGVSIDDYQLGTRTFHANSTEPAIPASLVPMIRSVSGLSNLAEPHPSGSPSPSNATSFATAYNGVLTPSGAGNSGGLPPGIDGTGQTIGLIEFDNFNASDLTNSLTASGLPVSLSWQVSTFGVNGGTTASEGQGTQEVLLDIVAALGVAPGADIVVFSSYINNATQIDMVNAAFNQLQTIPGGPGNIISDSWTYCEYEVSNSDADSMEALLQAFKISGVSFFTATGDYGATCVNPQRVVYPNRITFPADAPDAVAVGGTFLQVGAGNSYLSEELVEYPAKSRCHRHWGLWKQLAFRATQLPGSPYQCSRPVRARRVSRCRRQRAIV